MTTTKRVTVFSVVACLAALAFQPGAEAGRRLTDDEVAQRCIDTMNTGTARNRTKIIGFGSGAVSRINALQARGTPERTILKTADVARRNIAKTHTTANKQLEAAALKGVRELNKRQASSHLAAETNEAKDANLGLLQTVADDCYAAIDGALAD